MQANLREDTVDNIIVQDNVVQIRSLIDRLETLAATSGEIKKPDEGPRA